MIANGSPIGAALAVPGSAAALLANKADTARIRTEVDIVVPFKLGVQIAPRTNA
jgi:hypothetical protein